MFRCEFIEIIFAKLKNLTLLKGDDCYLPVFSKQQRHLSETISVTENAEPNLFSILVAASHAHSSSPNRKHAVAVIILIDDRLIFSVNPHGHSSNKFSQLRRREIEEEREFLRLKFGGQRAQVKHHLRIILRLFERRGQPRSPT